MKEFYDEVENRPVVTPRTHMMEMAGALGVPPTFFYENTVRQLQNRLAGKARYYSREHSDSFNPVYCLAYCVLDTVNPEVEPEIKIKGGFGQNEASAREFMQDILTANKGKTVLYAVGFDGRNMYWSKGD